MSWVHWKVGRVYPDIGLIYCEAVSPVSLLFVLFSISMRHFDEFPDFFSDMVINLNDVTSLSTCQESDVHNSQVI